MVHVTHPAVKKANRVPADELAAFLLPYLETLRNNPYRFEVAHSTDLRENVRTKIWGIFEENMQTLYTESSFGWSPPEKQLEMFDPLSRFILVWSVSPNPPGSAEDVGPLAYGIFRFEREDKQNVVYCYELQVAAASRRMGLGKALLQAMECIGRKLNMRKVMLTILKANLGALRFYSSIGYLEDPTSPDYRETDEEGWEDSSSGESCDYQIFSKAIQSTASG